MKGVSEESILVGGQGLIIGDSYFPNILKTGIIDIEYQTIAKNTGRIVSSKDII
ncbi:hypothetical protein NSQ59_21780 [Margalitia sp. FSL K6-0131]|uniref:hypothetical protein n=1 Tax=Margalitia sp. FSL K6-0131 TaxID=2954604 RepID=UPI0030F4BFE2